jgi:hypothetical protein
MSNAQDTTREEHVRRARVRDLAREEMSELGRDLFDLSREYESSGEELLTEEEIEAELARRRGGYVQQHAT